MRWSTILTCMALMAGPLAAQESFEGAGFSVVLPEGWRTQPGPEDDIYAARLRGPQQGDGPMGVYFKRVPVGEDLEAQLQDEKQRLRAGADSWSRLGDHVFLGWSLPSIERDGRLWGLRQYGLRHADEIFSCIVLAPLQLAASQVADLSALLASLRFDGPTSPLRPVDLGVVYALAAEGEFSAPVPYLLSRVRVSPPGGGMAGRLRVQAVDAVSGDALELLDSALDGSDEQTWRLQPVLVSSVSFSIEPAGLMSVFVGFDREEAHSFSERVLDGLKTALEFESRWLEGFPGPDYLRFDSNGMQRNHFDGWGQAITYTPSEALASGGFAEMELRSSGRDGERGSHDDLVVSSSFTVPEPVIPEVAATEADEARSDEAVAAELELAMAEEEPDSAYDPELDAALNGIAAGALPPDLLGGPPTEPALTVEPAVEPTPEVAQPAEAQPVPVVPELESVKPRFASVKLDLDTTIEIHASFADLLVRDGTLGFQLGLSLFDPQGVQLYSDPEVMVERPAAQAGKRPSVRFQLALPPSLEAGLYTLELQLSDLHSGLSNATTLPFSVR